MVDRFARRRLAELVRHVVSGRICRDELECELEENLGQSCDPAIAAVAAELFVLFPSNVSELWPIRLRGRYRVSKQEKRRLAVAALFLYSEREYRYPPLEKFRGAGRDCCLMLVCAIVLLSMPFQVTIGAIAFASGWLLVALGCVAMLIASCILSRFCYRRSKQFVTKWRQNHQQKLESAGHYEVWPFIEHDEFEQALLHPPLLCGILSSQNGV